MTLSCSPAPGKETETVLVAVHASDPMTELGAASVLGADRRVKLVTGSELPLAETIVVVEESVEDGTFAFLREVRATSRRESPPRCVLVTDRFRPDALMTAIECGLAALLQRKDTGGEELVRTVLAVSQGAAYLSPLLQGNLLNQLDRMRQHVLEPHGLTFSGLSVREHDVLRLLAEGCGTEEIASSLAYSESTVKNVIHGVISRYGLNNRAHAVAFAVRSGLL